MSVQFNRFGQSVDELQGKVEQPLSPQDKLNLISRNLQEVCKE